jgi:hypothetical protein
MTAGMLGLTLSGAPTLALWLGIGGAVICATAQQAPTHTPLEHARSGASGLLSAVHHHGRGAGFWRWRVVPHTFMDLHVLAKLIAWFTWPAWPLALWSLWRWRDQLSRAWRYPHLALPLWFVTVTVGATWFTGMSDRALLTGAASHCHFGCFGFAHTPAQLGRFDRLVHTAVFQHLRLHHLGGLVRHANWISRPNPRANVARLAPEFVPEFSIPHLPWLCWPRWLGLAGEVAHRPPPRSHLEKHGLASRRRRAVLAAAHDLVAALLDYARSYAPLMAKSHAMVTGAALAYQYAGISKAQGAALMHHAQVRLSGPCKHRKLTALGWWWTGQNLPLLSAKVKSLGWTEPNGIKRPGDRSESLLIFRPTQRAERHSVAQSIALKPCPSCAPSAVTQAPCWWANWPSCPLASPTP